MKYKLLLIIILAVSAFNVSAQWTALSGPAGANVQSMAYSSFYSKVYVIVNQRLYVSADDGANWSQLVPTTPANFYVNDIMTDGSNLYALYYSNVYKSTDGGANWIRMNANGQYVYGYHIMKIATNTIGVYGYSGMFVSTDSGVNWVQLSPDETVSAVANSAGDLFYADPKGIRKHANPGTNPWAGANVTLSKSASAINVIYQYAYESISIGFDAITNSLYAGFYNDVVKSVNGGAWTSIKGTTLTDAFFRDYWGQLIMVSPTGNVYLFNWDSGKLFLTTNQGGTWTAMTNLPSAAYSNQPIQNIVFASDGLKAFAGTVGDGIFKSTNVNVVGATWAFATNGLNAGSGTSIKVGASRITYATGGKLWSSTDAGATWQYNTPALSGSITHIIKMPVTKDFVAVNANNSNQLFYSAAASSGSAWTTITNLPSSVSNDPSGTFADASNNFYASGFNVVYKTANITVASPTWTTITPTGLPVNYSMYRIATDATNFYSWGYNSASQAYEVYKFPVAGGAATKLTLPSSYVANNYGSGFFVSPSNKLYVAQNNAIFTSADAGATWNTINFSNSTVFPITGGVCGSTQGALYITKDDGLNWVATSLPSSDGNITDIDTDGTNFYASTYNMPALKFTGNPVPSTSPTYINFSWQPTGGPFGGNVNQFQTDNSDNFYALSGNGQVFKAPLSLASWQNINPPSNGNTYIYSIYYDKVGDKLYANDYSSLYTSIDKGVTWTQVNSADNVYYRQAVKLSANGDLVMMGYTSASNNVTGIYLSADGGVTFGAAKYTLGAKEYVNYPYELPISTNNEIYFNTVDSLGHTKLMKGTNHGATWTQVTLPVGELYVYYHSADKLGNLFITTGNNFYKSSDGGTSWVSVKGDFAIANGQPSEVYPQSSTLWLMAATNYNSSGSILYKTTNAGVNWTVMGTIPDRTTTFASSSSNGTLVSGSNNNQNGISASTNGGTTFSYKNTGYTSLYFNQLELLSQQKLNALAGSNFSTVNGGTTWTKENKNFSRMFTLSNGTFIGYDNYHISSSADGGTTWANIGSFTNGLTWLTSVDGTFYFGLDYNYNVYYTSDLVTWTKISISGLPTNWSYIQLASDPSGVLYIDLYNSTSGSDEIYQVQFGTASKINGVKSPTSVQYYQNKIYIYDNAGAIFSSADGSVFTRQSTPTGDKLIIAAKNYYFIPSYQGALWLSRDQGTTWQNVGIAGYNGDFNDVAVNEFDGYAYGALPNSAVRKSANIVIPNDLTAPLATAFSPANNATGTGVGSIAITFDEAVKPTSLKTLRILDVASPISPVATIDAASGVQNGKTFTYTVSPTLSFGKTYFVVVDNDAFEDIFGNKFAGFTNNSTWKFSTRAAPTLTALSPALNATAVAIDSPLTATFSEPMTTAAGTFHLYKSSQPATPVISFTTTPGTADFVTVNPVAPFPEEQVVVTFDASYGDQALLGATSVYFHAGVVTDTITSIVWQNVVGNWGQDDGVGKMTAVVGKPGKWQITLGPTLRQYFNVAASKKIYRIAMVFRSANGNAKATPPATIAGAFIAPNGDIFINTNQTACVNAVLSNGNSTTFKLCGPLDFSTQYFVKVDANDFVTSDGAVLSFLTAGTEWVFTTAAAPDTIPPAISSFTPPKFTKGSTNKLVLSVTDNIKVDSVVLSYRAVKATSAFLTAVMTASSAPNQYEVTIPDAWLDELGLEYYFTAKDPSKNTSVLPASATVYFDSYYTFSTTASPTISSLPNGGGASDYRMFSIPYTLADPKISTIFSLGAPNKTLIRILTFASGTTADNTTWLEYDKLQNISRGVGYWINSTKTASFTITGATTPNDTKATEYMMTLKTGWNQIGNPYPFEISWNSVKTSSGSTNIGSVHTFSGSFTTGDKLAAGAGGFVFNGGSSASTIRIPFSSATGGRVGEPADPFARDGWIMPITLEQGDVKNSLGGVGMHPTANLSYDGLDDLPLPQLFNSIEMKFSHPEFFAKTFNRDVVPVQDEFVWEFTIDSSLPGLATMNWNNPVHNDRDIYLFDVALQKPINMLQANQYTFNPNESSRFRIYYGEMTIKPDYIFLGKAFPNPTNSSTTIPFSLPDNNSSYKVRVEVFDMMGKKVATVVEGELKPGFYNSEWNSTISNVPGGMYIYQMVASDASRNELKTGKIVLNK